MEITIKNYKKNLSDDLIKKSLRCTVRECDEVSAGVFESYIDELDRTYDVSLKLQKDLLIGHGCDCGSSASICQHQAALLNFIVNKAKPSSKLNAVKKNDPLKKALEEADPVKLQEWLLQTFKKQKELSLAFMNEFATGSKSYSPAEVVALTQDAVKAVINKRIKAETAEIKKIVELWTVIHRPMMKNFCAEPTKPDHFAQVHAIVNTVFNYRYQVRTSSKRFENYLQQVIDQLASAISTISDDESWSTCIGFFLAELLSEYYGELRREYIYIVISNFNSGSPSRRTMIVKNLMHVYQSRKEELVSASGELLKFLLRLVSANKQFPEYKDLFIPIKYANEYNLGLIDCLMQIGDLHTAEAYCVSQISQNVNSEYNLGYNVRLKRIYQETDNQQKLLPVIAQELLKRPDFDEYKRVALATPHDAEFKKWRNLVLANARTLSRYDKKSADFSLALRHFEGDWQGLLAYLDNSADYDSILRYAAELFEHSPASCIKKILEKQDSIRDQILNDEEPGRLEEILEQLFQLSVSALGIEPLRLLVNEQKARMRSWVNLFVAYACRLS